MSSRGFLAVCACARLSTVSSSVQASLENTFHCKRFYSPEPVKRFYAEVTVNSDNASSSFEIHLDKRKIKTPAGKQVFRVNNETIAQAIATEWASQKRQVQMSQMHLTALANTAQDNPLHKTVSVLINTILDGLSQDTIIFRSTENEKLYSLQDREWNPIIAWFEKEFNITVPLVESSIMPSTAFDRFTLESIKSSLEEFNIEALHALHFGQTAVQSLILSLAVVRQRLTVEEAVQLSRLETRFQIEHWGNVEWAHDLEMFDSMARLSAAIIFMYTHIANNHSSILS